MASDKQQVDRMERHRERLLGEGRLSLPPHAGRTAVITMYDPAKMAEADIPANRLDTMDREAQRILSYLRWRGRDVVYVPEATIDEFWQALDDVRISDMVLIGLAQLSRVHIAPWTTESNPGKQHNMVSFFDAISRDGTRPTITHLKQGGFYQRTSGEMNKRPLSIPFAWGFMADRTKIWAAPQMAFYPNQRHVRPRTGLVNVAAHFGLSREELQRTMSYRRAKEVFGARESLAGRRYPVPRFAYPAYDRLRENQKIHGLHDDIRRSLEALGHMLLIVGRRTLMQPNQAEGDPPGRISAQCSALLCTGCNARPQGVSCESSAGVGGEHRGRSSECRGTPEAGVMLTTWSPA